MDESLEQRLRRLMLFRVVMVTTLLLIAIYVETVSETLLLVNPLYFLIVATYALTIVYVIALRFLPRLEVQVYVQVVLDLVIITGLVYVTGGVGARAGFTLLYPISVLSGSIFLSRSQGVVVAALATAMYAIMLAAVRLGYVSAPVLSEIHLMPSRHVLYSVFVVGVSCLTVAMIGSYLSGSLRSVGAQLEEAAERMADLRELNALIVNSIQSGLVTADASGRILSINEVGASILGRRAAEVRGSTVRDLLGSRLLDPAVLEVRDMDRSLARLEIPYQRPDGESLDLGISVTPLAGSAPKTGHLFVFQNLTEIKRLEREVQVKEKLAAVGEMAAHLAHEIRNPLGSISGSAQVLMSEPNISAEQARLLAIITKESRRLSDALNQFLFQARPSAHPPAPVDIGPVIAEAVTLLRSGSDVGPGHSVDFQVRDAPHVCLADADQITQVFWNLARNGLEAMPHGGALRVVLARSGPDLRLTIRDEGRGMGVEGRRVFEPFQPSAMGTGLGLSIVYRIVREHRGDISVRSVPDRGTEVEVRLPLLQASVAV